MYNQSRQDQSPFRNAGITALNQQMAMLGLPGPGTAQQNLSAQDQAQAYLDANPDVAASGMDAYTHYLKYGKAEGRSWPGAATAQSGAGSTVGHAGYETATPISGGTVGAPGGPVNKAQQDAFAAFRSAPGYQFGLDEGNKSVQASAAARGGLNSGATLKALMKFGNNYADQQGYTPYMNRLASLAGNAQTSTNATGQLGQNYANQVGQNTMLAGQARAQGIYDSANAWSNFYNDTAKSAANTYAQNKGGY
jgi:hypothetical protein